MKKSFKFISTNAILLCLGLSACSTTVVEGGIEYLPTKAELYSGHLGYDNMLFEEGMSVYGKTTRIANIKEYNSNKKYTFKGNVNGEEVSYVRLYEADKQDSVGLHESTFVFEEGVRYIEFAHQGYNYFDYSKANFTFPSTFRNARLPSNKDRKISLKEKVYKLGDSGKFQIVDLNTKFNESIDKDTTVAYVYTTGDGNNIRKSVSIPKGIKSVILKDGFSDEIAFNGTFEEWCKVYNPEGLKGRKLYCKEVIKNPVTPSDLTVISCNQFNDNLFETFVISEGCECINSYALSSEVTTMIYLPKSLKYVGENIFGVAKSLTDVYFGGDENQFNSLFPEKTRTMYGDNSGLYNVKIHYNVTFKMK